ncbi:hypothetical protein CWATWH0003_0116 [Crocosphaera watsonii WH 0003]|uniref:Uncharacterized protein n=2 Tax=Crocosphaera watsonii TaxID=263511 RepID=G5IXW1_CROWT|nr:hypothetical protein CWATWH0003_0116 [Crocosphaera watsonii WH 0003]CCQ58813.1 hypothetical protein CWATWH0005_3849 [Crocosphaera watsonii WH 0005]
MRPSGSPVAHGGNPQDRTQYCVGFARNALVKRGKGGVGGRGGS